MVEEHLRKDAFDVMKKRHILFEVVNNMMRLLKKAQLSSKM